MHDSFSKAKSPKNGSMAFKTPVRKNCQPLWAEYLCFKLILGIATWQNLQDDFRQEAEILASEVLKCDNHCMYFKTGVKNHSYLLSIKKEQEIHNKAIKP